MTATSLMNIERLSGSAPDGLSAKRMAHFLAEYASWLFGSGATCIRLERNVARIAATAGMRADIAVMPGHIHLTVSNPDNDDSFTSVTTIVPRPVNYDLITRLSRLSWDIADGNIGLDDAQTEFGSIIRTPHLGATAVLILASAANAAFCRLFGGDAVAMAVVFFATCAGFYLRQQLLRKHVDIRLVFIACSFVSAVLAAADGLFSLGGTPGIAIGTSVLYLVPGIPFINSFCDLIDGHYICAISRLINATVLTCCLSVGLCVGMLMMNVGMF